MRTGRTGSACGGKRNKGIEPEADPDEGEFDWSRARVVMPTSKTGVYMRLEDDIISFFKEQGRGYQTRINAVLRGYVEAQRAAVGRSATRGVLASSGPVKSGVETLQVKDRSGRSVQKRVSTKGKRAG